MILNSLISISPKIKLYIKKYILFYHLNLHYQFAKNSGIYEKKFIIFCYIYIVNLSSSMIKSERFNFWEC